MRLRGSTFSPRTFTGQSVSIEVKRCEKRTFSSFFTQLPSQVTSKEASLLRAARLCSSQSTSSPVSVNRRSHSPVFFTPCRGETRRNRSSFSRESCTFNGAPLLPLLLLFYASRTFLCYLCFLRQAKNLPRFQECTKLANTCPPGPVPTSPLPVIP